MMTGEYEDFLKAAYLTLDWVVIALRQPPSPRSDAEANVSMIFDQGI
jgi:hypothetical protein